MDVEVLAAIGLAVLVGVGYVILHIIGEAATEAAKDSVFRRASFAMRRPRHRGLLKTGAICGVLAFGCGFMWLVVATNDFEDDAADARMFLVLAAVFILAAAGVLVAWWRRAGNPPR